MYISAYHDKEKDIINVVERNKEGNRVFKEYQPKYVFYYADPKGKYRNMKNEPVTKVQSKNIKDHRTELKIHSGKKLYESDMNVVYKCLEDNYSNANLPKLHIAFFDIETDRDKDRGYAPPEDPFMPITAISIYLQWSETMICLSVPPKTLSMEDALKEVEEFPNTILFETEKEMLSTFLDIIEDVDILSAYNGDVFDIPYIVNRTARILSKADTRKFCLWDQYPVKREFERYGKISYTYDLIGRIHMDSLEVYRKFSFGERHSYRLDAIAEYELGEQKVQYDGTLDQLYNFDYKKFIKYSIQDTLLLDKLDKKLRYLELVNSAAHDATVLLPTTMGAVAVTEQAIINESHNQGKIVPSRQNRTGKDTQLAGAHVAHPKRGLARDIGLIDINSLYPNTERALNMSPETVIGQVRQTATKTYINARVESGMSFAAAWEGQFSSIEYEEIMSKNPGQDLIIDWENGGSDTLSAAQCYELIFNSNQPWMISANGTIFTYEFEGIIPGLLKRWYTERKQMQQNMKDAIDRGDKDEAAVWSIKEQTKKLQLNSLYGAVSNPGCRFFDQRIGQSTTLTGRSIWRHMVSKTNEIITGEYDHLGKSIIYGDTDSGIFSAYTTLKDKIDSGKIPWERDDIIAYYDAIADDVNASFPAFMLKAFNSPNTRNNVIKAGREIVGSTGIFIKKKRYAISYYDKDGKRQDVNGKDGNLKAMGLDLKRSDTPVVIQNFLKDILDFVLHGNDTRAIIDCIIKFRESFKERPGWEKGSPKRVNNLSNYRDKLEKSGKVTMPGHVRASLNWQTLKRLNNDKFSMDIIDGSKVIVCKLKNNPLNYTSVAYPVDEMRLPDWFKKLPFDDAQMEETLIDEKLENLIGVLNIDLSETKQSNIFNALFDF
jgi:DNA polymerase elongation subunit (family B)